MKSGENQVTCKRRLNGNLGSFPVPSFTNELRTAMFEEPIYYFVDMAKRNRSILDLLYGGDTFVNRPLARHYGMPEPAKSPTQQPEE